MDNLVRIRGVLWLTLALNLLVSSMKLTGGYYFGSVSMLADGFHSFFDASSNVIGLIGISIAGKPPDESHPYGHKKYETFAAVGISLLLFLTCFEVLERAYRQVSAGGRVVEVTGLGFGIMFFTMGVNVFVTLYERSKGKKYKSDFLVADAAHTTSDILASTSVLAGFAAVKLGYPAADPIAAVVIALMIGRVGYGIMKSSSDILCDSSRLRADEINAICMEVPGVRRCHHVRSRGRDDAICIDLRIHVDAGLPISEAHEIAHQVEDRIRDRLSGVYDVVVHIEPEE